MLQNYSNKILSIVKKGQDSKRSEFLVGFLIVAGFFVSFYGSQFALFVIFQVARLAGLNLDAYNQNVVSAILAFILYILTALLFVYLLNRFVFKLKRSDVGLIGLPTWKDIGLAAVGFIVYMVLSAGLTSLAAALIPGFNATEDQNVGFANLNYTFEFVMAFFTLIILAPIAEEALFRGLLLGSLVKTLKPWISIIIVSLIFGYVHGSLNVGIDTFALSIILSVIRINTGTIWSGILIHMSKNTIAFYLLFINPSFLTTLGG
jgi:membrane protease YdiL (CAAX protease family)